MIYSWRYVRLLRLLELNEEDELIWQLQTSGIYSSHSMYNVINFRGIMHVYVPAVWKIRVPLGAFFSLWLLSKDRLLIRDNLGKRRSIEEKTCLFCSEDETINHLFFSLCGGKTGM
jgi:hypothetical protein